MKPRDPFFEIDPPADLDAKIARAATGALAENRKAHQSRRFWQWLLVPAFSAAAAVLIFRDLKQEDDLDATEFLAWEDVGDEDAELIEDLELMEDMELLEEWEEEA